MVLLLSLCMICAWVVYHYFNMYMAAVEQQVNADLAEHLADEIVPALHAGLDSEGLDEAVRRITIINPSLELYVLDADGRILAYFQNEEHIQQTAVSLAPIQSFLAKNAHYPILGDDPCHTGAKKVFSAVPVTLGAEGQGYLYVILRGTPMAAAAGSLRESYILRALGINLGLTMLFVVITGVVLFAFLTRRFRKMAALVCGFKEGNYTERVNIAGEDDVGQLGKAINEMAETIEAQVEALRRTDGLRREMVANVSHDLRTPLTSTRGYVERMLTKDGNLTPKERKQYLEAILHNTTHLCRLIEQLTELARLDAPQVTPQFESFSMAELAQDTLVKFEPMAQSRGIRLTGNFGPGLPDVYADIGLVEQALSNLLDNALQNTPRGGDVHLETIVLSGRLCVRVRDTGCGIAAEELSLVTQRFYRSKQVDHPDYQGTGLGLAIATEIVELHGSSLTVESVEGEGTIVSFSVSLQREAAPTYSGMPVLQ